LELWHYLQSVAKRMSHEHTTWPWGDLLVQKSSKHEGYWTQQKHVYVNMLWNMPAICAWSNALCSKGSKTYQITHTQMNHVTMLSDCSHKTHEKWQTGIM